MPHPFDTLIIGAGQAGVPLARALAEAGQRVALAERKHLGGSCVNFGCTPTKAALASARVAHLARRAAEFGIGVPVVEVDFAAVMARARRIAADSREGIEAQFRGDGTPRLLRGHARFTGRDGARFALTVEGEGETWEVTADRVVLNTGTRTQIPDLHGLETVDFLDAGNWIDRDERPDRLLVLGGGVIGVEQGQFYRRMGAEVALVYGADEILDREDADVAEAVRAALEAEGLRFLPRRRALGVVQRGDRVHLTVEGPDGQETLEGSHLFLATGRRPNTDDLGLDAVGLAPHDDGLLDVDERLATTVEGIFAAGDIRGGPQFTHTAYDDFRILRDRFLGDGEKTTERIVPYGVFTDPPLGRVGLTEREARERGADVEVACYPLEKSGKAKELGETRGLVKVVVERGTGRLLGAAVLGVHGPEVVHAYVAAMNAGASYTVLRDAVFIHPTIAEAAQSVLEGLGPEAP